MGNRLRGGRSVVGIVQLAILYLVLIVSCLQRSVFALDPHVYEVLRGVTIWLFSCLVATVPVWCVVRSMREAKCIRFIAISLFVFVVLSLLLLFFSADISFSVHRDLLITLLLLLCGYNLRVSQEDVDVYFGVYVIGGALTALSFLVEYGFSVPDSYLADIHKNQAGFFLGVLLLYCISLISMRRRPLLFFICLVVLLWGLLVLRARTSLLLALVSMLFFIVLLPGVSRKTKFCIVLLFAGATFCFRDALITAFFSGKDLNDIDSITSGRVSAIREGIDFLRRNFLDGSLWNDTYQGRNVHVFLLGVLVRFGFIFSLPVFAVYVYLFWVGIVHVFRRSIAKSVLGVVPFCLLFSLTSGLNEASLPFSPASLTSLIYLPLGLYLKTLNSSLHAARTTHIQ